MTPPTSLLEVAEERARSRARHPAARGVAEATAAARGRHPAARRTAGSKATTTTTPTQKRSTTSKPSARTTSTEDRSRRRTIDAPSGTTTRTRRPAQKQAQKPARRPAMAGLRSRAQRGATTRKPGKRRTARSRPTLAQAPAAMLLLFLVLVLNLIGLVMVLSASSVTALLTFESSWWFVERQAMWAGVGAVAFIAIQFIDYRFWSKVAPYLLGLSCLMLVLVLIPAIGLNANGSSRWLGVGSWRVQPSELAKLTMMMFTADLLAGRIHRITDTRITLKPVLLITGAIGALLLLQPDLGTAIILAGVVFVVLFVAGVPMLRLVPALMAGSGLAALLAFAEPYRRDRLLAFWDPWADAQNTGFQTVQSTLAIASGGVTGLGVGASRSKWGFLPEAHNDFIFAIIAEEFGLVGAVPVVLIFAMIGAIGVRTAMRAPDPFGMLLATGATAMIVLQAFVNLGAVTGILPVTGVPLPFVSAGGSSLVVLMVAAGMLMNVTKHAR